MERTRDQLLGHADIKMEELKKMRSHTSTLYVQVGPRESVASLHVNLGIAERARARGKLQRFHRITVLTNPTLSNPVRILGYD